ncbi:MAG TPA: NAD(P)H-quinone oxidoreductase [Dehalococcoidia bacterium]|nr:NAD(P)H-quinone oxidoreductase [Dehalococcoidia bacterium]
MKAAIVHEFGPEDVLRYEDVPKPVPGPGEVLIRVRAAGINRGDLGRRAGVYRGGGELPLIVGWDIAGDIEALGPNVSGPQQGARVAARIPQGGYAELAVAPAAWAIPIPDGVSYEQAASLPVAYLTSWFALKHHGSLKAGESCLVQAGASGVGVAGIQIARGTGARVFATAGTEEKVALARRLGAEVAINYSTDDFVQVVMDQTRGRGVDVVLESVGGDVLTRSVEALAPFGRLVCVGNSSRQPAPADLTQLLTKRISLFGFYLGAEQGTGAALSELLDLVSTGRIEAVIDRTFPLSAAAEAHRYVGSRSNLGKVLLIP